MLSIRRQFTRVLTFGILLSTSIADTVVLKSGEKVEGKLLKETEEQITLEVKVSASITDERVIPRAEIERIDKVSPETETYKAIVAIQVGTNTLPAAQYDASIRTLQAYIQKYPNGTHTKDVQATLDEFTAEKKRVEGGEVKLKGEWFTKEQVAKEKIQIGGALALEQMKNQVAAGETIPALNTFASVEKPLAGSASMPEMIEMARQLVATIKPAVERAIPDQKILKANKEQGFQNAKAEERPALVEAYKQEMAAAEAASVAAEKAGQWPPFIATNEKSLTILLGKANKEATRLAALPVDKMKKSVQLANAAKAAVNAGNYEEAAISLKEATTLWSANELAVRLNQEVSAVQKAAAATKPAATPAPETPKPKPSTPKPSAAIKAAATPAAPAEDDKPFFMTLPGAIGIVVVIAASLAGLNIFKKMKAKKASQDIVE